jgi:hypothetical protein
MKRIVRKYKYAYRDAKDQDEKASIANAVLATVQSNGARFLKCDASGEWQELAFKVALKKVYHSIRDSIYNEDLKPTKGNETAASDNEEQPSPDRRRSINSTQGLQSTVNEEHRRQNLPKDKKYSSSEDALSLAARRQQLALERLNASDEREAAMRLGLGGQSSTIQYPNNYSTRFEVNNPHAAYMNDPRRLSIEAVRFSGGAEYQMLQRQSQHRLFLQQQQQQLQQHGQFNNHRNLTGVHHLPTQAQSELSQEQLRMMMLSRYGK